MPAKLILATVAVAVIVLAGAAAVDAGVSATGQQQTFSESFVPSAGAVTALDQSELDPVRYFHESNVTVTNGSGVVMAAGVDYEWIRSNGTVETLAGGRLDGDSTADITYGYRATSSDATDVAHLGASGLEAGALMVFVLTVGFVVTSLRVLGAI